jgi:hypothetical protein
MDARFQICRIVALWIQFDIDWIWANFSIYFLIPVRIVDIYRHCIRAERIGS